MNPGDTLFERFELVGLISRRLGIWQARDLEVNELRLLALLPSDAQDVDCIYRAYKRFQDLSVPALPPVFEVLSDGQWTALIMGGESLPPILMTEPLPHQDLISRCFSLVQSLDLLNANGITHGCVDSSLVLSSSVGTLFLLPPLGGTSVDDDVIGLGRLFLKLLTADKASHDIVEPNRCSELLAGKQPLPALTNQLFADMLAGRIPGMRQVVQRIAEIDRMGKTSGAVSELPTLNTQAKAFASRPWKFFLPALALIIILLGICCLTFWFRWTEIRNVHKDSLANSTFINSRQMDTTLSKTEKTSEDFATDAAALNASASVITKNSEPGSPKIHKFQEFSPEMASALDGWLIAYRKLKRVGGEKWGGEESKKAFLFAAEAEEAILNQDFKKAEEFYWEATNLVDSLYRHRHDHLSNLITAGKVALEAGQAMEAAESFRLAILIDPDHEDAIKGAKRAKTFDQIAALVKNAHEQESAGYVGIARALYLEALSLDPDSIKSKEGLKRSNTIIEEMALNGRITDIFIKLENNNLKLAQKSLNEAASLNPDSWIIQETKKIFDSAKQLAIVQSLMDDAESAEKIEEWEQAYERYIEILRWIPNSIVAQDNSLKIETIVRLQEQLSHYIDDPNRLLTDESRASVRLLLKETEEFMGASHKVKSNAATLMAMLEIAERPIPVTLFSDEETEVTIYRVRQLGKFKMQKLSLQPGSYTVVGIRQGYRDFRRTLHVETGGKTVQFTVRCEEAIF